MSHHRDDTTERPAQVGAHHHSSGPGAGSGARVAHAALLPTDQEEYQIFLSRLQKEPQ